MPDQICEHCGTANPDHETYCRACGQVLPAGRAMSTQRLAMPAHLKPELRWGTAMFDEKTILKFEVKETGDLIVLDFDDECVVGRTHKEVTPDIDLSPFHAMERGVSRRHIKLTREGGTVMVQDLNSANGTFLNGMRLLPYQPRVLRNNDELMLGRLALRVLFQPVSASGVRGDTGPVITPPGPVNPIEPKISPPQRGDGSRKPWR